MTLLAASRLICSETMTHRQLKQAVDSAPRRTDRLTLLSLLAASPLATYLTPDCGLYVASAKPDAEIMKPMLESACVAASPPKPFHFVNSVSNAIGFYVARELGLAGPNLFIAANERVWENLIRLANLDLAAGLSQALMIHCDNEKAVPVVEVLVLDGVWDLAQGVDFELLGRGCRDYEELQL